MAVTSGTVYSGYQRNSCVYVSWQQTGQSIEKNETYINWQVGIYVTKDDWWYSNAMKINATYINGVCVFSGGTYSNIQSNGHHQKSSGTLTIKHNDNGSKSFSASISGWFYSYGTTSTGTGTFVLTDIPRVSDLSVNKTSVPADGSTTVIATATKKADAFTDVLTVSLGDYSKTVTSGTAFNIPKEWNNAIAGTTAIATVKLETFSGETSIGSKTADLTITVPDTVVPVINDIAISEAVAVVTNAFGSLYIQNLSQLNVSIDASGAYGSTIRSYSATLDGVNYIQQAFTSNVIKTAGALEIAVKVTDSRGRTAEESISVNVVEYALPTITSMVYMHCDSDGTQNSSGNCTKVTIAGKVYPVSNKNTKALKLKYKATTSASYTERALTISDWTFSVDVIINNTDPTVTFEYVAELTDKINANTPETFRITSGIIVLSRKAGGDGVTIFGEAKEEGFIVEGGKPAKFTGDVVIEGNFNGSEITDADIEEICDFEEGMTEEDVIPKATKSALGCVVVGDGLDVANGVLSNGFVIKKLWENASPTSNFAAQTVSLDLSSYDFVGVLSRTTSSSNHRRFYICPVGASQQIFSFDYAGSSTATHLYNRSYTTSTTGITFESGSYKNLTSTAVSTQNGASFPLEIYGIKGVS